MQQEDVILEKLENHDKRLDDHDKRITKNTDDIGDIKIDAACQETTVKNLNKSMDKLTETINKWADKFDSYLIDGNKQSNASWQWKIGIWLPIAVSIILLLLGWLNK